MQPPGDKAEPPADHLTLIRDERRAVQIAADNAWDSHELGSTSAVQA